MENQSPRPTTHEQACVRVASHFKERWMRHYVASKLRSDPVFAATFEILRESHAPLLDVGCGVGLLPFYLRERGFTPPITGLDLDERKLRRGRAAASRKYRDIDLVEHNVATRELKPFRGNVAIFDLLHYLPPSAQQTLLKRLAGFVPAGGLLLIRDSPRDDSVRSWMTRALEVFAQGVRWNIGTPLHFPKLASIHAAFAEDQWTRRDQPAWGKTPFNNRLFIFQRRPSATVLATG